MRSLKARLLLLWVLSLVACAGVGLMLVQLSHDTLEAQIGRAQAVVAHSCGLISARWRFFASHWSGPPGGRFDDQARRDLAGLVGLALAGEEGIEGGIWQAGAGSLAYGFPTYPGDGPKLDFPVSERDRIDAVNAQAARDGQPESRSFGSGSETLLLHACPLPGAASGLTAWTMTRVHATRGFGALMLGLGVLLALVVLMAAWLGRILIAWGGHVVRIEAALARAGLEGMPVLERTGERELDQVVDALNDAAGRVTAARLSADAMAVRAGRAERLAALGRVAAGVAHEIRNPIAAARLQAENALAGDDARRRDAIADILEQLDRLNGLVTELLAMTQRVTPDPKCVDLRAFLDARARAFRTAAEANGVAVTVEAAGSAVLDPAVVGRVLDNLLANAVRSVPEGGSVAITAERAPGRLTVVVADSGPGIAPAVAASLFEPFVTSRPDGTGLGLAIARELAEGHGGRLSLAAAGGGEGGAVFALELPQPVEGGLP